MESKVYLVAYILELRCQTACKLVSHDLCVVLGLREREAEDVSCRKSLVWQISCYQFSGEM